MADVPPSSSARTELASYTSGSDVYEEATERTPCASSSCSVATSRSSKSRGSLPKQVRFCEYTDWSYFDVEPPTCLPQAAEPSSMQPRNNTKRFSFSIRSGFSRLRRTSSSPAVVDHLDFSHHMDWTRDDDAPTSHQTAQDPDAISPPKRSSSSTSLSSSVLSTSSTELSFPRERHSLHANIVRQPLRGTGGRVFRRADTVITREASRPVSAAPPVRGNWDDLLTTK